MGFGRNDYGQLGLGDTTNRNLPTLIPNLNDVKEISPAYYHSLFLLSKVNKLMKKKNM